MPVSGQTATEDWSTPESLLDIPIEGFHASTPDIVVGPSENAHLFFFARPASDAEGLPALYYARWAGEGWGVLNDVVVSPDGNVPGSVVGMESRSGYLYVVWASSQVWYSKALASVAADPYAWSEPALVFSSSSLNQAAAAIGDDDVIHILALSRDKDVYYVQLLPDDTIAKTVLVHHVEGEYYPYYPSLIVTPRNRLYACWSNWTSSGHGVYCSSSQNNGDTWSTPENIAEGHRGVWVDYSTRLGSIVRIIWGGVGVGGRYLQTSTDDGATWSVPFDLTQGVSMSGFTGQVASADSAGRLHVLINPGDGRYQHSIRDHTTWSNNRETGWEASDWIAADVIEGNQLVVAYWVPGRVLSTWLPLGTERITPAALPTPPPIQDPTESIVAVLPTTTPDIKPMPDLPTQAVQQSQQRNIPLFMSVVVPLLIVVATVLWRLNPIRK